MGQGGPGAWSLSEEALSISRCVVSSRSIPGGGEGRGGDKAQEDSWHNGLSENSSDIPVNRLPKYRSHGALPVPQCTCLPAGTSADMPFPEPPEDTVKWGLAVAHIAHRLPV